MSLVSRAIEHAGRIGNTSDVAGCGVLVLCEVNLERSISFSLLMMVHSVSTASQLRLSLIFVDSSPTETIFHDLMIFHWNKCTLIWRINITGLCISSKNIYVVSYKRFFCFLDNINLHIYHITHS